jgi:hypothetical protein
VDPEWPESGRVEWDSTPHGPGHTRETVRGGVVVEVDDPRVRGLRTVVYDGAELTVEFEYTLKGGNPFVGWFVKRALRDSLRRTLQRFAIERRADTQPP